MITSLVLHTALSVIPCEYVIDFGPVRIPAEYKVRIELVARDGTCHVLPIEFGKNTDTLGNRDDLAWYLKDNGWATRLEPGSAITVVGTTKKSPVRSVSVHSTAPQPTVRWVPLLHQKK